MLQALFFSLLLSTALAGGLPNIAGLNQRLENLTCKGAQVLSLKEATTLLPQLVDEACSDAPEGMFEACFIKTVKELGSPSPWAIFSAQANDESTTFQMSINVKSRSVFNSTRIGTHGDGETGINLMFHIYPGHDMDYVIESSQLSPDGNSASYLYVPVKRRIVSDLVYIFTEGCTLSWQEN